MFIDDIGIRGSDSPWRIEICVFRMLLFSLCTLYVSRFNNIMLLTAKTFSSVREDELLLNNNNDDDDDDYEKKRWVAAKVKVHSQISPRCNHF